MIIIILLCPLLSFNLGIQLFHKIARFEKNDL